MLCPLPSAWENQNPGNGVEGEQRAGCVHHQVFGAFLSVSGLGQVGFGRALSESLSTFQELSL